MATSNNKKLEDYGSFDYADYTEGESVTSARDKYNEVINNKPGDFASQYTEAAKQAMDKYLNRDKFTYDVNGDALYQQYKDQYINQGKLAMQDTIGQAAAMTGGFGNSYAQNVGQQTYQGYLQQLNDKVPELYQLALDQYNQEGENLLNQYGLLSDRENTEYGRYRDTVADWTADRGFYSDELHRAEEFDYSKYSDDRNFAYSQFSDDRNLGYQLDRDAVSDSQWQTSFDESIRQYEQEYQLKVRQIEEDERNGKISREVAQREIALAEEKFKAEKDQAAASLTASYITKGYTKDANGNWVKAADDDTEDDGIGSSSIREKASGFTNDNDLANYLDGLEKSGAITGQQADQLYAEYKQPEQVALEKRTWTLVDGGGINWFGGVDNNAVVKDQYGNTYRGDTLVDAFVDAGMSKKDAKAKVASIINKAGG